MAESLLSTSLPSLLLSVGLSANEKCALLFNVGSPLKIPMKEFDEQWWPLISNVWTECSHYKSLNGDFWKTFSCRFAKRMKSSSCIKIFHYILSQVIQVECFQSSPDYAHSLRDSDQLKCPHII
ncbi:hypothetical protein BC938DRAFT_472638 [Jimgerdemannia flammicorona]|uniref:Uncharacterized protein n=1 Tax=Jimgerdemannia flammicorona TaxID=994334 RepID=A0A433Q5N7_9FUNG|nr:hypothetical protein BC938DRAFT_472638 [Jimgerdemannia flammicorona]